MHLFEWPALGWFGLAIVAATIEVLVPHFGSVFVAAAAVIAGLVAAIGGDAQVQVVTLAFVMFACLSILRPRLAPRLFHAPGVPSRTDVLIGRDAVVTHDIDPTIGAGRINVGGQDWAARSAVPLAAGTRVRVVSADGIVLEV